MYNNSPNKGAPELMKLKQTIDSLINNSESPRYNSANTLGLNRNSTNKLMNAWC